MRVSFPRSTWIRHVSQIVHGATSGWDFKGRGRNGDSGFLDNPSDTVQVGDLVVGHEVGKTARSPGSTWLWIVLDGPLLCYVVVTPSTPAWSTLLVPHIAPLLRMPAAGRALFGVNQLLRDTYSAIRMTEAQADEQDTLEAALSDLVILRARYSRQLASDVTDEAAAALADQLYLREAFEVFVARHAAITNTPPDDVRAILSAAPSAVIPARRVRARPQPPPLGGRRLTLRND